jgi:signal transduction histidine kinase
VTVEALIALFAALLTWERLRRGGRSQDVLLFWALVLMGASHVFFAAIPSVVASRDGIFTTWASLLADTMAAALLAAAVVTPVRRIRPDRRQITRLALAPAGLLCASAFLVYALRGWLPPAVGPGFTADVRLVGINATPAIAVINVAGGLCLAVAAAGFARGADKRGDRLSTGLAVACALAAMARVDYLLFPSVFTVWVSIGDVFRLGAYVVLFIAAVREVQSYVAGAAKTAALRERRRIACDLHDRLVQDLASIQRNLHWLDQEDEFVQRALASAGNALADARQVIAVLSEDGDRPVGEALDDIMRRVGEREGTSVTLDVSGTARLDAVEHEAIGLIVSEAITNAARHGLAREVHVELVDQPRLRLRVTDRGRGFDAAGAYDGFGLEAMAERAAGIGARLRVYSRPGEGTRVEVVG